jgi:hypothetical protein
MKHYRNLHIEELDTGWTITVQFLAGQDTVLRHNVQNGSWAYPVSYPLSTRLLSSAVKWWGHEANHSPLFSAKVKNVWSYICIPHTFAKLSTRCNLLE